MRFADRFVTHTSSRLLCLMDPLSSTTRKCGPDQRSQIPAVQPHSRALVHATQVELPGISAAGRRREGGGIARRAGEALRVLVSLEHRP